MGAAVAIPAAAAVGGALISSQGSKSAAETQANAANNASQLQYNEFLTQQQNLAPWIQAGTTALSTLQAGAQPGGQFNKPFTMADFQNSAGYNFEQQQGQQAIAATAAAGGLRGSPAEAQALIKYNQGLASTNYQQAYNDYMTTQQNALNQQQALAQVGQSSLNALNTAGTNTANQIASNTIGAGNATAAGQVGTANAWGSGLSNLAKIYTSSPSSTSTSTGYDPTAIYGG
jgi:hypothetical protein